MKSYLSGTKRYIADIQSSGLSADSTSSKRYSGICESCVRNIIIRSSYIAKLFNTGIARKSKHSLPATQVTVNKLFERKTVNIFLPFSFNICFGFSKEPSH